LQHFIVASSIDKIEGRIENNGNKKEGRKEVNLKEKEVS